MKKAKSILFIVIGIMLGSLAMFLLLRSRNANQPIDSTSLVLGVLSASSSMASTVKGVLDVFPKKKEKLHRERSASQEMDNSPNGKQFRDDGDGGPQVMRDSRGGQQKIVKPKGKK